VILVGVEASFYMLTSLFELELEACKSLGKMWGATNPGIAVFEGKQIRKNRRIIATFKNTRYFYERLEMT